MGAAPSKTPKEILNENKSAIRQSIREIDREERQIKRRQRDVEATIKKSAKAGRINEVKIFAKDLVRIRKAIEKFEVAKANLQGIQIQLMTASGQEAITSALKGACQAYRAISGMMDPKAVQRIVAEYSKESMRNEMMQELTGDALDNAMGDLDDSAAEDELVNQVLSEIGITQLANASEAPSGTLETAQPVDPTKAATDNNDMSDLQNRLNNL